MLLSRSLVALALVATLVGPASAQLAGKPRFTGPWKLDELAKTPAATFGAKSGLLQEVYYAGEPFKGKPTKVFALIGRPEGPGPFPAMLLVHGGGGRAFAEWAKLWAERGYVSLAIDTAGQGADGKRHADAGPDQGDDSKFRDFRDGGERDMWTYHAVAAVIRGHSLLAAQPEVDRQKIGITGISWGGYLTSIITGLDERLKVSVPVYGCGHLAENSVWLPRFEKMQPDERKHWTAFFDPQQYLPGVRCPILFVNGTNDFAYPLDSYQKSYRDVPGRVDLCVTVGMPHGHQQGWAPKEIGLYVDSVLKGGVPLAKLGPLEVVGKKATAKFESPAKITKAQLHWTTDTGPWQKRTWKSADAAVGEGALAVDVPAERPIVYFATITDERGATVSTPHVEEAQK